MYMAFDAIIFHSSFGMFHFPFFLSRPLINCGAGNCGINGK